ncbi:ASCH domain-containing protein [Candidatus Woesearchaeota archaeon]|nr:ASCH domain-containing protein [Candidatus Woesearchaeota archaeon]
MVLLEMQLYDSPYERISKGSKKLEVRLNDEKRQKIQIDDAIVFYKKNGGFIKTKVVNLHQYNSFEELFKNIDLKLLGFEHPKEINEIIDDMYDIYTKEQEEKYGVLGIEIKLGE